MKNRLIVLLFLASFAAFAQSPYPGRLPTDNDLLVTTDDTEGNLAVAMTSVSGSIILAEAGTFVPNQAVSIDKEIIKICAVSGRTLTVCPGGRGLFSAPSSHVKGSRVAANIIAAHHNALKDLLEAITLALGPGLENVVKQGGTSNTPPTCSATYRMKFWMKRGGIGAADDLQMCVKDEQENYAWHSVVAQ